MRTGAFRQYRKLAAAMAVSGALVCAGAWVRAQIMGDLPTMAPEVALPLVTSTSVLRVTGTWECVQPEARCQNGTGPAMEAVVQVVGAQSVDKDSVIFAPTPDKNNPGRYYIHLTAPLDFMSGATGGGVLNFVTTDDGLPGDIRAKGAWVVSVMVEDKSATPAFSPYIVQLSSPRPDPITRFAQLF